MTEPELPKDLRDLDYPEIVYQYRCPNCGDAHRIDISVISWTRLMPQDEEDALTPIGGLDGMDVAGALDGNDEFEASSEAVCRSCDHIGKVGWFTNPHFKEA